MAERNPRLTERFRRFSERTATSLGSVRAFLAAVAFTVLWAFAGPMFGFSDTWQLTMNTVATVVAFLMVFVIQNTQNRDTRAIQLKLDELIRAQDGTRKELVRLEDLPESELRRLHEEFRAVDGGEPASDASAPEAGASGS